MNYSLKIKLVSDTTFGRGDGVAGLIDSEVEHDVNGLPFLRGRTLKGLLSEECANLLFAIGKISNADNLAKVAENLFGKAGSSLDDDGKLHVGNATLPKDLQKAVSQAIDKNDITRQEVLDSLTTIRRQTKISESGSPEENSLRSVRVIIRNTEFTSDLMFDENPTSEEILLLALSARSLQRVGLGRNRGRGKVCVKLFENGTEIDLEAKLKELEQILTEEAK